VVVAREDEPGKRSLVAYVAPDPSFGRESGVDLGREHLSEWRALFDDTYRSASPTLSGEFDIAGWNSSYTGEAIPAEEMREWVDATVDRILAKNPSRVLEIGCGTGLLLYRIAPGVERYVGCDLSSKAILGLRERVSSGPGLSRVELFEREASDFTGIEPRSFDTVIINSVSQYLPSAEYFLNLLESAVESLCEGGRIFVGDVRSYPLLEAFHASVERARAGADVSEEELEERIGRGVEEESELLLAPSFFYSLKRRFPRVSDVEVFVKRGRFENELTRFRYEVFVHVERKRETFDARWIDWESPESLRAELRRRGTLGVRGIPNRRLEGAGPELQDLSALAAESGHALEIGYSSFGEFFLDALFRPVESIDPEGVFWPSDTENGESDAGESNHPLRTRLARLLIPRLRRRAQELLPEYMVPSTFVLLERMPIGPTGKVDRKALPSPSRFRAGRVSDYAAPRSQVEKTLAAIWTDVLGLDRVGVRDNFFELGGDSILGIQIVARAKSAGLSLMVRQIFEHQTIAELAGAVDP
ncbi:MAG: phosphopantetheine-binding protein, partial [Vicinamibacteria bacterium]